MAEFPAQFTRDCGCTEVEWLRWLPDATAPWLLTLPEPGAARVQFESGHLQLRWHELPPRRIALMSLPRLAVSFAFEALGPEQRSAFMHRFDLYTQRGGG